VIFVVDKKFWSAVFTLTGTVIGAGILGLPYVFAKSGFGIGIFWLLLLGLVMILTNLYFAEVCLRTKGNHQLFGYAKKYLGKFGSRVTFVIVIFGVYLALLAYLIGEGQSLSRFFTGSLDYSFYFAIGFWVLMVLILRGGLRDLKKVESWGVIGIILVVIILAAWKAPHVQAGNLFYNNPVNFFVPFGVILFALSGFFSVPELRMGIKGKENSLWKAIIMGMLIPIVLYAVFSGVFIGVLGENVSEVATLSFGNILVLLGILTMLTSYVVLGFVLKDTFQYDLKYPKITSFFFTSGVPLLLYLVLNYYGRLSFVDTLDIGGAVSTSLAAILVLIMGLRAKKMGNRKPEFSMPLNWFIVLILSAIFLIGIIVGLFDIRIILDFLSNHGMLS
jgi:amino acid permease